MEELRRLGAIGYIRGIRERLDELARDVPEARAQIAYLRGFISEYRINDFMAALGVTPASTS
jgi:hypothetical protein